MLDIGNRCVRKWHWLRILLAKKMSLHCLVNQQIPCLRRKQIYSKEIFLPSHCWGFEIFGRLIAKTEPATLPHSIEHPTKTGHYLAWCFKHTASFKKEFKKKFCGSECSNPEAQFRKFKENLDNSLLGIWEHQVKLIFFYRDSSVFLVFQYIWGCQLLFLSITIERKLPIVAYILIIIFLFYFRTLEDHQSTCFTFSKMQIILYI